MADLIIYNGIVPEQHKALDTFPGNCLSAFVFPLPFWKALPLSPSSKARADPVCFCSLFCEKNTGLQALAMADDHFVLHFVPSFPLEGLASPAIASNMSCYAHFRQNEVPDPRDQEQLANALHHAFDICMSSAKCMSDVKCMSSAKCMSGVKCMSSAKCMSSIKCRSSVRLHVRALLSVQRMIEVSLLRIMSDQ